MAMLIGDRIRVIREEKNLSQGDIEKRCGLLRTYLSRVENSHTVPSVETLEKLARALGVPLYQLFYAGKELPKLRRIASREKAEESLWGAHGKEIRYLAKLREFLSRMEERDQKILVAIAQKMARQ